MSIESLGIIVIMLSIAKVMFLTQSEEFESRLEGPGNLIQFNIRLKEFKVGEEGQGAC